MPRLRIAPQWLQEPFWIVSDHTEPEPVDFDELGLSDGLADRIEAWIDMFDAILDPADPDHSHFPDDESAQRWRREGELVAAAIGRALGRDWQIVLELPDVGTMAGKP